MALTIQRKSLFKGRILTTSLMALALMLQPFYMLAASQSVSAVSAAAPSTNAINKSKGWAHANETSKTTSSVTFDFVSTRAFQSCFEYRADGNVSQRTSPTNYNTEITDGLYPFTCVSNTTKPKTVTASQYVEVRMVFGAEKSERFDWERFDVAPLVCTYDFQAQKMWEITWGHSFENRNGNAPVFTKQSHGGMVSLNGAPVPSYMASPSWRWLYVTDKGAALNAPYTNTYGFADGTTRTVNVSWNDVSGCQVPTITWGMKSNQMPVGIVDTPRVNGIVAVDKRGGILPITGKFTDDHAPNYLQFELVYKGNLVKTGIVYGSQVGADGKYTYNMPIPTGLESGEYSLFYTATDFNNGVAPRLERKFLIDNTTPTGTITTPMAGSTVGAANGKLSVSGTVNENYAMNRIGVQLVKKGVSGHVQYIYANDNGLYGTNPTNWNAEFTGLNLQDGAEYGINLSLVDQDGNVTNNPTHWFTVDSSAPTLKYINRTSSQITKNTELTFLVRFSEDIANLDEDNFELIGSATGTVDNVRKDTSYPDSSRYYVDITGVSGNGDLKLKVKASETKDSAGNTFTGTTVGQWYTIDNTAPTDVSINLNSSVNPTEAQILAFDTNLSRIDVSLWKDGVADWIAFPGEPTAPGSFNKNYATQLNLAGLSDGMYTIRATATDAAGNAKDATNVTFTVDRTAPAVTVNSLTTANPTPALTGNVNDPTATVVLTIDGVSDDATNNGDGTWSYTVPAALALGSHTVSVVATDVNSNVSTMATGTLTVQAVARPVLPVPQTNTDEADGEQDDGESAPLFPNPSLGFLTDPVTDNQSDETETNDNETDDNGDVLGEQDQAGTPLEDTGEVLGLMDHKWFGIAWYWFLVILGGLVGAWLMLAAAIRRHRGEEV